jgi:hypothetical protein
MCLRTAKNGVGEGLSDGQGQEFSLAGPQETRVGKATFFPIGNNQHPFPDCP